MLLTQDKDFGKLVYRLQRVHQGIILIGLGTTPASEKACLVNHAIMEHRKKLEKAFTAIQANAVRIRKQNN